MEESLIRKEKRRYPRVLINLPLEYQDLGDSNLRGGMVVNVGAGGFLIECTRNIPVGMRLKVTLLFSKGFELADFEAVAQLVMRERHRTEDSEGNHSWEGYRYGLEFLQVLDEDRWKLNLLLGERSEFEEMFQTLFCQL